MAGYPEFLLPGAEKEAAAFRDKWQREKEGPYIIWGIGEVHWKKTEMDMVYHALRSKAIIVINSKEKRSSLIIWGM